VIGSVARSGQCDLWLTESRWLPGFRGRSSDNRKTMRRRVRAAFYAARDKAFVATTAGIVNRA
jgi:hypothetical protein